MLPQGYKNMDMESPDPIFNANLGQDENLTWTKKLRCSQSILNQVHSKAYRWHLKAACPVSLNFHLRHCVNLREVPQKGFFLEFSPWVCSYFGGG